MGRVLYLQCDSGISGDMVVGSLLDAGASEKGLREALASLHLDGFEVVVSRKRAGSLDACDFDVVVDGAHANHDHDMEWLYGGLDDAPTDHNHHDHHHHAHGHGHHHEHRGLADVTAIIDGSNMPETAKQEARGIFAILAEAEAKAHGETIDTVHFHEVGAVDSIVDVVAAAWCLNDLGIDDMVVSALAEGEGHVRSAHGVLPIPVPAVANIVEAYGLVLKRAHRNGELVTPTGAAIAATATRRTLPEMYRIVSTGIGTGKRAYDPPSTVRATVLEEITQKSTLVEPPLWKLETEVDDCTGEALGHVLDRLYEVGAREAHFVPVFMKKCRPGYQIEVLCGEEDISAIEDVLFEDTTTIGIRRQPMERTVLLREADVVETEFGEVRVKRVTLPNGTKRCYAEHDSIAEIATGQELAYQDVLRAAQRAM